MKSSWGRPFLLISTMLILIAFVFQPSLLYRGIEVVLLVVYAVIRKKRFRLLPNLLLLAGITGANLLTPVGEVLFRIGAFPVTRFALEQGLHRSLLFIGLVYLSRATVSCFSDAIPLPGRIGALTGRTLYHFEQFMEYDISLKGKGFVRAIAHLGASLDDALLSLSSEQEDGGVGAKPSHPGSVTLFYAFLSTLLFLVFLIHMH